MKNTLRKLLSVFLCVLLVFGISGTASFADGEEELPAKGETEPFRISVSMNGDAGTQRGFCWFTKTQTDTKIEVLDESGASAGKVTFTDSQEWEGNYYHKATVSELEAGGSYTFRVGNGTEWSEYGSFVTDDGDDSFSFIEIADVQATPLENFQKAALTVSAAFETLPEAEFVVNCGDFTNDSTNEEWDRFDCAFAELNKNCTMVPVAGNHDGLGVENWFNNMFNLDTSESVQTKDGVNYSFDYGNAHIAVLNTNDMFCMTLTQMKWLKNDLDSTDKDWKICFMHKSPYTLGKDGKWPDALYLGESLARVFDMCDVDLVVSGHDHMYLRTKPLKNNMLNDDGTTYILSGTAGTKRYEVREFLAGMFLNTDFIDALTVQKGGYGNYWNGEDWNSTSEENIGGCFNTVQIKGGTLTFNSYIRNDETGEVKNIDTYSVTKETGKNKATFSGDNTTSAFEYYLGLIPSFICLAIYTFGSWLPRFLLDLPYILYVYITQDTF
ncbi:MAG: metallophosphoesterase family protein [Clostridia bacterium]|nr:metallophosphoesterase family protein [Clostridia bacterium]